MSFSYGNNIFNEILKKSNKLEDTNSSDVHINNNEIAHDLQRRLCHYFGNNPVPILKKSEKYSGIVKDGKNEPLGGPIDPIRPGINNRPGTLARSSDFPFWGPTENKNVQSKKTKNVQEKEEKEENEKLNNDKVEKFTDYNKENFNMNLSSISIWAIILIIIIIIVIVLLVFKNKLF